jgi:hypothetical protein
LDAVTTINGVPEGAMPSGIIGLKEPRAFYSAQWFRAKVAKLPQVRNVSNMNTT